mmetsp:Transcript_2580/g.6201  ORF Transcript_2580/g.6201 Transcript_2580/m.6201 type:complete len:475 (-) Transcript_2580:345-1769(-)
MKHRGADKSIIQTTHHSIDRSETAHYGGVPANYSMLTNQEDDVTGTDITPENKSADVFSKQVPPNATDPESVDSLIASQMAQLSVAGREKAYMDVHGIPDFATETPELIHRSLLQFQHEIEMLPDKKAYDIARRLDPTYVEDRDFRLAFLRCDKFDCQKAALRIIRHFQMKLDLFGEDKLAMDITQDDLDAEDMHALYSSAGRFLNAYDSGGRIINFLIGVPKVYTTDAVLRRAFYNIMVAFRDNPEVQRRGAVSICWGVGDVKGSSGDNADLNWKLPRLNEGSPMRISALHMCYTDEVWKDRIAVMRAGLSKQIQVRVRVHYGTVQECLVELRGHGVDPACIPINEQGEISDHLEYGRGLEQQRKHERLYFPLRRTIGTPSAQDVLLGKGTPFQIHPGNKNLRKMVSDRFKEYDKAPKGAKKAVAREIVGTIKSNGGLFLKQDGNKWVPASDDVSVLKISAAFRTLRLKSGTM